MSPEDYQQAIDLTPEQKRAFSSLKRAVTRCRQANVYFYQVLDTLNALNGNNVQSVITDEDAQSRGFTRDHPSCLAFLDYPHVETTGAFADDAHFIVLHP